MKKKSVVTKFLSRRILLLIQLIISIVFLGYIYYLKMLPIEILFNISGNHCFIMALYVIFY